MSKFRGALQGYGDIFATAAVGDLHGNGTAPEIIIVTSAYAVNEVRIYALNNNGTLLSGWPKIISNEYHSYAAPTLADLDGNGDLEILIVTDFDNPHGSHIYAFNHDGTSFSNFPILWESPQTFAQAVVGDIDGNGDLEIFSGTRYGGISAIPNFHGWQHDGSEIFNWPRPVESIIDPSPTLFDIDGDGNVEVLTANPYIDFYAFNFDGSLVSGFPFNDLSNSSHTGSPSIGDVDRDGDFEVAFANKGVDGQGAHVSLLDFSVPFYPDKVEWGTMHHDNRNTNLYEQPVTGTLQQNTTWWGRTKVRNTVTVPAGKTLNIQGGTTVRFAPGAVLNINGQINVTGTQYEPVIFDPNSNVTFASGSTVTIDPGATITVEGTLTIASNATISGGGNIVKSGNGKIFVTNSASALASNNSRKLARDSNGNYHLVFESDGEICYERLNSSGAITKFLRISAGDGGHASPCITARDDQIYVIWQRWDGSAYDVLTRRSTNAGVSWSNIKELSPNHAYPPTPVITSPATNKLMAVWRGNIRLLYRTSNDNGINWAPTEQVPSTGTNDLSPTLAPTTTYWGNGTRSCLVYGRTPGSIHYRYYIHGPDSTESWNPSVKNLSQIVPGSYNSHKDPSIAPSGSSGDKRLHAVWQARSGTQGNYYVIINRKANDWGDWPSEYLATYYEEQQLPSVTGLHDGTAELLFRMVSMNHIYKMHYDGAGWGAPVYVGQGNDPSVSVGHTTAKYVWTAGSSDPYEIPISTETLSKTGSKQLAMAYHRSIAIIDTTTNAWLEVRLDKLSVKTKSGEELIIPFEIAQNDSATLTPDRAFVNLASLPVVLPADAESLSVRYQVSGRGLSKVRNNNNRITVEFALAAKNGGDRKLPIIDTDNDSLPENARTVTASISDFAGKEFNLRTNLTGIARKPSLIASLGHIYEVVEEPLTKELSAVDENAAPQDYILSAYPNPFWSGATSRFAGNPSTQIRFVMKQAGPAALRVYNINGQIIRELLQEHRAAGEHTALWDGRNDRGLTVTSGVYFIRFEAGHQVRMSKVMLLR